MNIRADLVNILNEKADAVSKLATRAAELERDIKSGRFTAAAVCKELQPALIDTRVAITKAKDETRRAVAQLVAQRVAELEKADALNPDELDEGDMKLLNSGLPLTERDLKIMLGRHRANGNRTMQQAVTRWARQHDINLGVFVGNEREIAATKMLPSTVDLYIDHWIDQANAKDMIQKMFVDTEGA